MSPHRGPSGGFPRRARWAVALAGAVVIAAGTSAAATGLPVPTPPLPTIAVPTVTVPSLPTPSISVSSVPVPLPSVPVPSVPVSPVPVPQVTSLPLPGIPNPTLPAHVGSIPTPGAGSPVPSAVTGMLTGVTGAGTGSSAGSVLNLGVNASPVATACVQAKGTGTAVANMTVTVGGRNVTAPLVQALPGVLAPCPTAGSPSTGGLEASVPGLVGACVRATAQPPVNASVLLLDKELIGTLTAAGVPLQSLVVPCPAGVSGGGQWTPAPGGAVSTPGAEGAPGSSGPGAGAGAAGTTAARAGQDGAGACGPTATSGWFTLDSHALASVVPGNIPQTTPWVLLALALLGRRRLGRALSAVRRLRARPVVSEASDV